MAKLRSSNIEPSTGTTLALGASGDSIAVSSDSIKANTWQDLGGNNLFVSNGSGTLSNINSALAGGGYTKLAENSLAGNSSCDMNGHFSSTYDEYMIIFVDMNPSTDAVKLEFQCSIDGGSNYNINTTSTFFRAYHNESGTDSALSYETSLDQANGTGHQALCETLGNGADESCSGILYLYTPSNTTFLKQYYARTSYYQYTDYNMTAFIGGYFNTTSAINGIQFKMSSGQMDGYVALYGVG